MSIFDQVSGPVDESPEMGHEEEAAEQFENQEESYEEDVYEEQEEVQPDAEETDPEEDGHSEQLLAGKYKSVQDLEEAYRSLQREFTKQRMVEKTQPQQPPQQPIQSQPQEIDFNDPNSIINAINQDPMGTIAKIAQQTYQQARTVETQEQQFMRGVDEVSAQYADHLKTEDDMNLYFGKVSEVCRELGVNPKTPPARVLKMAAQELWGNPGQETVKQAYEKAKAEARKEAAETRRQKAGLSAPASAKPQEKPKTPEDLVADSIVNAGKRGGLFGRTF